MRNETENQIYTDRRTSEPGAEIMQPNYQIQTIFLRTDIFPIIAHIISFKVYFIRFIIDL